MQYQRSTQRFWRRHPWITAAALMSGGLLLLHEAYPVVGAAAVAFAYLAAHRWRHVRRIERAGLSARADLEHRLASTGDQRGVFGRFPPLQAGWFPDPGRARQIRYFDGVNWTGHTAVH